MPAVTTVSVRITKPAFPAVRRWRVQLPTCFCNNPPPPKKAPTGRILILCCAFYPPPTLFYSYSMDRNVLPLSPAFYCEMEPFSITQRCWPALYFTRLFLFPLFLSGWELIWEAQLLVGCPQRTPNHNKDTLANIASLWRDFIYVKYWDTSTFYHNLNLKCG